MCVQQIAREPCREVLTLGPRVALVTPYAGGNLGDANIQDAMITNSRIRLADAQFSGFTHRNGSWACSSSVSASVVSKARHKAALCSTSSETREDSLASGMGNFRPAKRGILSVDSRP
jgi:hypothetical protein